MTLRRDFVACPGFAMARFIDQYGLDPNYAYSGSIFGIRDGSVWHNYGAGS